MRFCISFGNFHKYFFILFISIIFQIVNEAIYGFNYFEHIFDDVKIFHNEGHEYFSKHILIHLIFSYIGLFIFTVPFVIYEYISSKYAKEEITLDTFRNRRRRRRKNIKNYTWILLTAFLWVVEEILFIFYTSILGGLEFWLLELLIVFYLSSKMFHTNIYNHQKCSMLVNLFPLLTKYILVILSVKLEKKTSNLIYIRHLWVVPIGILIYSIIAFIRSFANIKLKTIMDFNFTSHNIILMIYGALGAIITSILCIFTSNFNCNLGEIENYICNVSENNNTIKYIDSFSIYHNTFQGYSNDDSSQIKFEIMVIIFGGITFFINRYSSLLVIRALNPVIYAFSFPILFLFRKITLIINTLIISKSIYIRDVTGISKLKFSFDIIGDILSFISFLVYTEIVEINIFGLNYNIAKNIISRTIEEIDRPPIVPDIYEDDPYPFLNIEEDILY